MSTIKTTPIATDEFDWGQIDWLMDARATPDADLTLALMTVKSGHTAENHCHGNCSEAIHLTSGTLEIIVDGRLTGLEPGSTILVPANSAHKITCTSSEAAVMVLCYGAGEREYKPVK
jgi:quercetin dioxygenase-like cupin family protein